ncbi:hypothetical protein CEXT_733591 [Caerostris extrusa]|uniref:Uncharacterized protein n=1 Tax=Caerostris extrusa TaxID=172846 RepID=A0AAV4U1H6_CAEEX|nr:hypothetical protein CEXT_733591 [Caerostris extrusa]
MPYPPGSSRQRNFSNNRLIRTLFKKQHPMAVRRAVVISLGFPQAKAANLISWKRDLRLGSADRNKNTELIEGVCLKTLIRNPIGAITALLKGGCVTKQAYWFSVNIYRYVLCHKYHVFRLKKTLCIIKECKEYIMA